MRKDDDYKKLYEIDMDQETENALLELREDRQTQIQGNTERKELTDRLLNLGMEIDKMRQNVCFDYDPEKANKTKEEECDKMLKDNKHFQELKQEQARLIQKSKVFEQKTTTSKGIVMCMKTSLTFTITPRTRLTRGPGKTF